MTSDFELIDTSIRTGTSNAPNHLEALRRAAEALIRSGRRDLVEQTIAQIGFEFAPTKDEVAAWRDAVG